MDPFDATFNTSYSQLLTPEPFKVNDGALKINCSKHVNIIINFFARANAHLAKNTGKWKNFLYLRLNGTQDVSSPKCPINIKLIVSISPTSIWIA